MKIKQQTLKGFECEIDDTEAFKLGVHETVTFAELLLQYNVDNSSSSSLNEEDSIPIPYLFRNYKEMPKIEQKALDLCKGNVLDIGCGAANHSLILQKKDIIPS